MSSFPRRFFSRNFLILMMLVFFSGAVFYAGNDDRQAMYAIDDISKTQEHN
jgi:hypothetical protein